MALQKTFDQLAGEAKSRIKETTPKQVAEKLQQGANDWVLIDVRENDEFRSGHLPGARGIGRGILEYHIADEVPDTETEIILYCRGGNRSALAADALQQMGYTNVYSMSGGYREWIQDTQRPITTEGEPIQH